MIHCVLHLFLGILLGGPFSYAEVPQLWKPGFSQFQSKFLQPSKGSADGPADQPFWAWPMKWDFIRFDIAKVNPPASGICQRSLKFEQSSLDSYLKECEPTFATGSKNLLANIAETLMLKDRFAEHPLAQPLILQLPDDIKLRAHLFLQSFHESKPMVVLRAGIFSNSRDYFPERHLVEFFYQQLGYHVLLLESLTSSDFIANNSRWSIVGFDEGLQNYYIGNQLRDPKEPLSKLIKELHFSALSMGGAGGFYAAYLQSIPQSKARKPPYNKFLLFCPLIDFNGTLAYHRSSKVTNWFLEHIASRRLSFLKEKYRLEDKGSFLVALEQYFRQNYRGPLMSRDFAEVPISNRQKKLLESADEKLFFELNQLDTELLQIKSPMLVVTTEDDVVVPRFLNSDRWIPQMQQAGVPILQLRLSYGYHCSLPVPYNHQALNQIFAKWFQNDSDWSKQE